MTILGRGELALRLVPLLFGIGTIAIAFWIGRRWMGPSGAAVLVLLCTFGQSIAHYAFEAKHYSADTFWAALLPALAARVTESDEAATIVRRSVLWWLAAAVGQMLANGALLVAPGCALFLGASILRRDGRAAARFALFGLLFLAAFGLHYQLSLRATHESAYLRSYWTDAIPPAWMGLSDRVRWIGGHLGALALNPGGTGWRVMFWACAVAGLALTGRRALGLAFATVPLSAFVLAGLGIVPLYERFVLWMVPALYVGVALLIDRAARVLREPFPRRGWQAAMVSAVVLVVASAVCLDVYGRGGNEVLERTSDQKQQLDDRAAVRWLVGQLKPGDALLTSHLGWPAVWWYGDISIANADAAGVVKHPSAVPLLEAGYVEPGPQCDDDVLRESLKGYRRVLVYLGFEGPPGYDFLALDALDRIGGIEAFREYSERGRAAVIDLHDRAARRRTLGEVSPKTAANAGLLSGCLRVGPARRW
jgi:hypothetical protein